MKTQEQLKDELKQVKKSIRRIQKKLRYTEFYEHGLIVLNTLLERKEELETIIGKRNE